MVYSGSLAFLGSCFPNPGLDFRLMSLAEFILDLLIENDLRARIIAVIA